MKHAVFASHPFSTSQLAKAVGIHVNTVRLYEKWGWIPPALRTPAGYRKFSQYHLEVLKLVRLTLGGPWSGKTLRRSQTHIIHLASEGDLPAAFQASKRHINLVNKETAYAETAIHSINEWKNGAKTDNNTSQYSIKDTAKILDVSVDMLRNWERNGLIIVPRNPGNRYRLYSINEIRRLRIIRAVLKAGYSVMAVLRMLTRFDQGGQEDTRALLNTPDPDDDIVFASDKWLTTLQEEAIRADQIHTFLAQLISQNPG